METGQAHHTQEAGVVGPAAWMILLTVLLFWIPFIGPLIAGFVGGKKAGTLGNAIIAALLPAVIIGVLVFALASSLSSIPLLGALLGFSGVVLVLMNSVPLILGAVLGSISAD